MKMELLWVTILTFLIPVFCYAAKIPTNFSSTRQQFIQSLLTSAQQVNRKVMLERARTNSLYHEFLRRKTLSSTNMYWLRQLADYYGIKQFNLSNQSLWKKLMRRIDIIPPSLVIAQAAYESAWGYSRFAREGYGYFGERCYTPGCGLVPRSRAARATFEVRRFASVVEAVTSYVHNLNTNSAYIQLRKMREKQRVKHLQLHGEELAFGLEKYSAQQFYYVQAIRKIIKNYNLWQYDE
jgi:Bax protein